jgi:hypothetical protein
MRTGRTSNGPKEVSNEVGADVKEVDADATADAFAAMLVAGTIAEAAEAKVNLPPLTAKAKRKAKAKPEGKVVHIASRINELAGGGSPSIKNRRKSMSGLGDLGRSATSAIFSPKPTGDDASPQSAIDLARQAALHMSMQGQAEVGKEGEAKKEEANKPSKRDHFPRGRSKSDPGRCLNLLQEPSAEKGGRKA